MLTCSLIDCGDLTDLEANNGAPGSENQCNMPCAGDPIHICGGSLKMSLYKWQGQMNVWHTPTNTGHYEVRSHDHHVSSSIAYIAMRTVLWSVLLQVIFRGYKY